VTRKILVNKTLYRFLWSSQSLINLHIMAG